MSIENKAANTELDENDLPEELVSEQPELEEGQDIANLDEDAEQVDETDDNEFLIKALTDKAESEEDGKTHNIPRSTAKLLRKTKRLEAENNRLKDEVAKIEAYKAPVVKPVIPTRDWDSDETEEQFQFRMQQSVYEHNQKQQQANQMADAQKKQAIEHQKASAKALELYSEASSKLNYKDYDDIEERVLSDMHPLTLETMSRYNAEATPKILLYLSSHPDIKDKLAAASHQDVSEFNRIFGKLEAKIEDIEARAKTKRKQISKAPSDNAVSGSGSEVGLQAKIDKAANDKNFELYRKLKAQQLNNRQR